MGNQISYSLPSNKGKVILLDGTIQEFDKPLTVAELMLEYPQQMVVDLKSSTKNKLTPLPADKTLDVDKIYLMVPLRKGKLAHLSPQEAQHILLRVNNMLRSKTLLVSSTKFLPLFANLFPFANNVINDIGYCKFSVSKGDLVGFEGGEIEGDNLDVFEKPDLLSRQVSGKSWKPSLDTIEEKKDEINKASNWVLVAKRIHNKGLLWG